MDRGKEDGAALAEDEGTPRVTCPICGARGFIGEGGCPHWFAGGGMDGGVIGGVAESVTDDLREQLASLNGRKRAAVLLGAPPEIARVLRALLDEDEVPWWQGEPGVQRSEKVEVNEASGTWAYWDWFHPDPDFPTIAAALAERARDWVTDRLARKAG